MPTQRGVVVRNKREIPCPCPCHVEEALHFMACCHPPKTEEGRTGLALLSVLEMQIGLTGGASAEVAAFRQAHLQRRLQGIRSEDGRDPLQGAPA